MRKVYISSTYRDLLEHRRAVHDMLRSNQYDVIRTEDLAARDRHTRGACESDVGECDIYVGIFAWRYGSIPRGRNPRQRSFTELEYRKARRTGKTCLLFLKASDGEQPHPSTDVIAHSDGDAQRMLTLREELTTRCAGYFRSPDDLAKQVLAAIYQEEATRRAQPLAVLDEVKQASALGLSYLPDIEQRIPAVLDVDAVELQLGPVPWWNTRLHVVSALAEDFTSIRQLVFVDEQRRFLGMYSPSDVRRALARRTPELELAYAKSGTRERPIRGDLRAITQILQVYATATLTAFSGAKESEFKEDISPILLKGIMGEERAAGTVEMVGQPPAVRGYQIVGQSSPFVALLRDGRLESFVDRVDLVTRLARQVLLERL